MGVSPHTSDVQKMNRSWIGRHCQAGLSGELALMFDKGTGQVCGGRRQDGLGGRTGQPAGCRGPVWKCSGMVFGEVCFVVWACSCICWEQSV